MDCIGIDMDAYGRERVVDKEFGTEEEMWE